MLACCPRSHLRYHPRRAEADACRERNTRAQSRVQLLNERGGGSPLDVGEVERGSGVGQEGVDVELRRKHFQRLHERGEGLLVALGRGGQGCGLGAMELGLAQQRAGAHPRVGRVSAGGVNQQPLALRRPQHERLAAECRGVVAHQRGGERRDAHAGDRHGSASPAAP